MATWLQEHLENFVKPVLGEIPKIHGKGYTRFFAPQEMSVIKNMWRSIKSAAEGRPILLAGRDVMVFYILAKRENLSDSKVVFRPDISRLTVSEVKEDYSKHFHFDTGFMGSIPKTLRAQNYTMASSNSMDHLSFRNRFLIKTEKHQIFPRMTGSRALALKIERTPKYWKRGYLHHERLVPELPSIVGGRTTGIRQELSSKAEFYAAALLTQEIWTDNSPRFVEGQLEVGKASADMWLE